MRKIIITGFVVAAVGGVAMYATTVLNKGVADSKVAPKSLEVTVLMAEPTKVSRVVTLPGRVTPHRQSDVRPQVDGIITQRFFEEGKNVKKGDQLYQIDDTRYKALLNSAIADLNSAKADVQAADARMTRYQELIKVDAVSKQQYEDVKAEKAKAVAAVGVAQAAVDLAKVNLEYSKVLAPISGYISRSYVSEGALVSMNQSQSLATITELDPVYVDIQQSGDGQDVVELRQRLANGDELPVKLVVTANNIEREYESVGKLKFSEVTLDQTAASVTMRAIFENQKNELLPGMFVKANIDLGENDALLVPQRATVRGANGELGVWVVGADNKVTLKQIKSSEAYKDQWIVSDGITKGDQFIVEGYQKARDGMIVNPVPFADSVK